MTRGMRLRGAPPLPVPGLVHGSYPLAGLRPGNVPAPLQWMAAPLRRLQAAWPLHGAPARRLLQAVQAAQAGWQAQGLHGHLLRPLRARLAREGWHPDLRASALGCAAAAAQQALGLQPFGIQLLAAHALLDDRLVQLPTGEGKTLAAALAAAVAALAGVPVHVMTANDYLAARDARRLAPMFEALGLRVACVVAGLPPEQRRDAYAADITYCTAREAAFDALRDTRRGEAPPLLRGQCMALLDEADSLLVDDATVPLVLSAPQHDPQQRAACFQALALARQLQPGLHWQLDAQPAVACTPLGEAELERLCSGLAGAWLNRRHRLDLVASALQALHLLQPGRDYLVREGRVQLLDAVTGRVADGRSWSRGLHTLVELKEGLAPSPAQHTVAQTSFQRFFGRYLRLAGLSGTLAECRAELQQVYGRQVVVLAPRRATRRLQLPSRLYPDAASRQAAIVRRVAALHAQGRPVLVGTDGLDASQALSAALAAAGLPHRRLDARHDADEAAVVAAAGQRGAITVATRMAGRGTDILLGEGVAELGGLHVIDAQDNPSARLDRQLAGRCARQGDPGSAEAWRRADAEAWRAGWLTLALRLAPGRPKCPS
ncbi:DEAD/DEAH box helicase [Aquincola sp. J276]|uniref:preprotein translocase subunit SecA n=1 Tax=Aquincola sp. J276 TaxID=2898432 RepID=UPI002150871B|nr:DEAD/DEAH box helicase [Aquincola sp. J276]MCR5868326.1 DEAD/DEAH box helicase [Aquincola sp. J276]